MGNTGQVTSTLSCDWRMSEALSTRQKVALCAALGTGVVVGATGLVIYQRMCQVSDKCGVL